MFLIIVTPQQINLYNNTYTTDIELSSVECRDTDNVIVNCPFTDGTVGTPVFNDSAITCSNVVKQVRGHQPPSCWNLVFTAGATPTCSNVVKHVRGHQPPSF
jgi:hypothetical protein